MSNWGGKRQGAGSGGQRPGAGRPRQRMNLGAPGSVWVMEYARSDSGFMPDPPRGWRLLSVSDGEIEFQDVVSEAIITLRKPDTHGRA